MNQSANTTIAAAAIGALYGAGASTASLKPAQPVTFSFKAIIPQERLSAVLKAAVGSVDDLVGFGFRRDEDATQISVECADFRAAVPILAATIADEARAAQFVMFWSGE